MGWGGAQVREASMFRGDGGGQDTDWDLTGWGCGRATGEGEVWCLGVQGAQGCLGEGHGALAESRCVEEGLGAWGRVGVRGGGSGCVGSVGVPAGASGCMGMTGVPRGGSRAEQEEKASSTQHRLSPKEAASGGARGTH